MPAQRKPVIAVIGAGMCSSEIKDMAVRVGRYVAESGGVILCGGRGGVMEGAAQGAKLAGGPTIGIIPTDNKADANEFIDYVIVTGMGEGRNLLVAKSADAVIAFPGKYGTLSEMAFALLNNIPVVSILSWRPDDSVHRCDDPLEAAQLAMELARKRVSS